MSTLTQTPTQHLATASRPEIELLLCCCRTQVDAATTSTIKTLIQPSINWNYLIQTATRHKVVPLLYQNLNNTCPEAVPHAILNQLKNHFHTNATYNKFMTTELLKLLNLFQNHNIPAIPFKGPILAATAYDNLALRQFCDLDILVQKQNVLKVKDLLVSQGYKSWSLNPVQETAHLESETEHTFVRNDGMVSVDLHWELMRRYASFPLCFDHLWEYIEYISVAGTTVCNLSPEDLLLFLCVHGTKHCWERLAWICDVAELIRVHQKMDWERVMLQANALGSERMLFLGLILANDYLGTTIPKKIWQKVQADSVVKSLAVEVKGQLFNTVNSQSQIKNSIFYIKARERLLDKVRYCLLGMTPNGRDFSFIPLPSYLSFLYYVIRPIRLAYKYGWKKED